ncbi:hypothetical protein AVEN_76892-1 [Araneus ventricosus]|uniref:Uncharacterized protein n=1 Tax=Araneus ventricosus TaxID=182803 RepID=A0A4Y2MEF6_ARAVE|nr:hypothetical protein AVEN_76892-1 [Araneus ventricosus]
MVCSTDLHVAFKTEKVVASKQRGGSGNDEQSRCWPRTRPEGGEIAKYVLLSLLCFDSAFSATIETAQKLGDYEDEGIYGEYEDERNDAEDGGILHLDFFRFTTRKRYIWEDWTVPTRDPVDYGDSSSSTNFLLYVIVPISVVGIVGTLLYYCIKNLSENNCYSAEFESHSSIIANRFTAVHRPPIRRNQYADSRGEPAMRVLFSELDSNGGAAHATGATISFVNSPYASTTQDRREPDHTVAEKPPDYSTVTLSDLVNPTKPDFPAVKSESETPPPEYGKRNPFL